MKIKNYLILSCAIIFIHSVESCSPAMLGNRIQVGQIGRPANNNTTAIVSVELRTPEESSGSQLYFSQLENSIRNCIFNSGQFEKVQLKRESSNQQEYSVYFDINVVPKDNGQTNWLISWPAVYPLVLYWPLQQKRGKAEVVLNVKVITPDKPLQEFSIKKETPYSIKLYSFFRTGPIEEALQKSYYDAIDELSQKVRDMSFEYSGYEETESVITPGRKANIAVLDLEAISVTPNEARTLTNKLRGELVRTRKYTVIERSQMEEILNEQGFQLTGMCSTDECYVEAGKLLGVEQLVGGSIGRVGNTYLISLRLIDVETGVIIKLVDEEIEGSIDEVLKTGISSVVKKLTR